MKKMISKMAKKGLALLEKNATKKANAECVGMMYEPKIPKKLKKTLCLVLVCVLATGTLFGGSATNYYAAECKYEEWQTSMYSPISSTYTDLVNLYVTTETYEWAVTSYNIPNSYGEVKLNGNNCFTTILNGGRILNTIGQRDFTIYMDITAGYDYAQFKITMGYDSYPTWFNGYVKIK
ncbi:MAG: cyclic lactone autoinducer peptide [Agathobacter sp.]|nr:cyclic lactone autoinducer peptide [Agathobacter sp.]